eukprot:352421-Chlamydomonas_euryale.AAC.44
MGMWRSSHKRGHKDSGSFGQREPPLRGSGGCRNSSSTPVMASSARSRGSTCRRINMTPTTERAGQTSSRFCSHRTAAITAQQQWRQPCRQHQRQRPKQHALRRPRRRQILHHVEDSKPRQRYSRQHAQRMYKALQWRQPHASPKHAPHDAMRAALGLIQEERRIDSK